VSSKSWLGVTLPGFSALASSTQASCAARATASEPRREAPRVEAGLRRAVCLTGIRRIVKLGWLAHEMSDQVAQRGGLRLDGVRAVVTGASSGIGAAIAEAFGGAGAALLVTHRDSAAAASAVAERIAHIGKRAVVAQADLGERAACEALVAQARERLGGLDVWVNNAGADVLTGEAADWDWERKLDVLLTVDLKGTVACSYAAGAVMREQPGGGTIVNMSWDHVTAGMAGENPELFSAVKGGVLAFSKSLARGLAPRVRVNVLCPGWIETAFAQEADRDFHRSVAESTPLARWGRPEDVAAAALWLASPEAAFVTGQAVNINGGVVM
jgi:3-oxoacyl-[acyl-carrier protein] reductase